MGYVIIWVQVEGVRGYDEDHMALVEPNPTTIGSSVLVILCTPTINRIINVIKESKIDELSTSLNRSRIAQLLACCQAELSIKSDSTALPKVDTTKLNEAVKTTKREEIDVYSSKIIHGQMKTLLLESNMHVMTQTLRGGNGTHLPHRLSVVTTYTKVTTGSK